eukprot:10835-Heterococcus_DN1.PRE.1
MVILGADEEWRNIQLNQSYALPSSASLKEGICWIYTFIHMTLHDDIYSTKQHRQVLFYTLRPAPASAPTSTPTPIPASPIFKEKNSYSIERMLMDSVPTAFYGAVMVVSYLCSSDNVRDAKAAWWYPACFVY